MANAEPATEFGTASTNSTPNAAEDIERKLATAYQKVSPALVWIDLIDAQGQAVSSSAGIVVSAEGHVLMPDSRGGLQPRIRLSDGREVAATQFGCSHEWGVSAAKLSGPGPWPHVEVRNSNHIHAGQVVCTLSFALRELSFAPKPLLDKASVSLCAPGKWFLIPPDGSSWKSAKIAFDLDGRLIGLQSLLFGSEGTVFTQTSVIETLWNELKNGTNLDEMRLRKRDASIESRSSSPQKISEAAERVARSATVRIRSAPGEKGYSGVLISADGYVATCAHHFMLPGTNVTVSLPDGRDLQGQVVGLGFPRDLGIVKIKEPGKFNPVELGLSGRLQPGDSCLGVGYGPADANARDPIVRELSIVDSPNGRWSYELFSQGEKWAGGDCGGGVFDKDGKLVAILLPGNLTPHAHKRVEALTEAWSDLLVPLEIAKTSEQAEMGKSGLQSAIDRTSSATVEILDGKKRVALGTVVSKDGVIVTKASILPSDASCRLSDGRLVPAKRLKIARDDDLAILKIGVDNLSPVLWSESQDNPVGTVVGFPGTNVAVGVISHPQMSIPPEPGYLWANFRDTDAGPEVEEIFKLTQSSLYAKLPLRPLRKGDIFKSIDGHSTRSRDELTALFAGPARLKVAAGDVVRIVAQRSEKEVTYDAALWPPNWPRPAGQSIRCSGFVRVYSIAVNLDWEDYGGPVVDRNGKAIGVAIAGRQRGWSIVLPASVVRSNLVE